jgi:hypothetical protein
MVKMARAAAHLEVEHGAPREMPFDEKVFDAISHSGKAFRHIDNQ